MYLFFISMYLYFIFYIHLFLFINSCVRIYYIILFNKYLLFHPYGGVNETKLKLALYSVLTQHFIPKQFLIRYICLHVTHL